MIDKKRAFRTFDKNEEKEKIIKEEEYNWGKLQFEIMLEQES